GELHRQLDALARAALRAYPGPVAALVVKAPPITPTRTERAETILPRQIPRVHSKRRQDGSPPTIAALAQWDRVHGARLKINRLPVLKALLADAPATNVLPKPVGAWIMRRRQPLSISRSSLSTPRRIPAAG